MKSQSLVWMARKFGYMLAQILTAITLSFILIVSMPGNAYQIVFSRLLRQGIPLQQAQIEAASLVGYNATTPWYTKFFGYFNGILHGNLGYSIIYSLPVSKILANAVPWTVLIVMVSLSLAFFTGWSAGLVAALHRGKKVDNILSATLSIFHSVPVYVLAVMLLITLGVLLHLAPIGGGEYAPGLIPGFNLQFIGSVLYHLYLPILAFYLTLFPSWMFGTRAIATSVMKDDFVQSARARNIGGRRFLYSYVGKNSILPQYTHLMYSYGLLFGGSIFIESIFDINGLGFILATSSAARDYFLATGAFLVVVLAVILGNTIADLSYGIIDPRVRAK